MKEFDASPTFSSWVYKHKWCFCEFALSERKWSGWRLTFILPPSCRYQTRGRILSSFLLIMRSDLKKSFTSYNLKIHEMRGIWTKGAPLQHANILMSWELRNTTVNTNIFHLKQKRLFINIEERNKSPNWVMKVHFGLLFILNGKPIPGVFREWLQRSCATRTSHTSKRRVLLR